MKAVMTKCPADFSETGEQMECSTPLSAVDKRHTGCTAEGICLCSGPYAKPVPETYEGMPFLFLAMALPLFGIAYPQMSK